MSKSESVALVHETIFSSSLFLSLITLVGATFLFLNRQWIRKRLSEFKIFQYLIPRHVFGLILDISVTIASRSTHYLQSGQLKRSLFLVFLSLSLLSFYLINTWPLASFDFEMPVLLWGVCMWLLVSSCGLLIVKEFISGLIALGIFGLGLSFFFAIHGAPDLAMTQVLIETLMIVLIVFSLSGIKLWPDIKRETLYFRMTRGSLAVCMGVLMTYFTNHYLNTPFEHKVNHYYATQLHSTPEAHNLVNLILVQFRALDTMGETLVVLVASLGMVYLLRKGFNTRIK